MKFKWNYVALPAVAGMLLFASTSFADNLEDKHRADKQKVVKQENITVMGTRSQVDVARYPGAVNVIKADDLKISPSVIEDLSKVPGFETGACVGRNIGQQFTIRGFGYQSESRVIIKQDGIRRSTSLFSNHISSFRTDPEILRQVEVIKGSSSVAHGSGAIGGVVGMSTKDAFDYLDKGKTMGTKVITRYERNNYKSGALALYGNPNEGAFDYLVYGKYGKTGDLTKVKPFEDDPSDKTIDNDEKIKDGFIKLGYKLSEDHQFKVSVFHLHEDVEAAWQTLYHSKYPETGPVVGDLDQTDLVLAYTYNPVSEYFNADVSVFSSKASYHRIFRNDKGEIRSDYENKDKSWGLNLKNQSKFSTGPVNHKLVVGMDYTRRSEDAIFVYAGELQEFGSMPNNYNELGLFLQDEIPLMQDRMVLYLGGRYDRFERSVDGKTLDYDGSRFSPRIGGAFEIFDHFNLLANYSEAFRAPTPHETSSEGALNPHYWYMPNPDLKSEISKEAEFGFSYDNDRLMNGKAALWARALYFIGNIEDMIDLKELPELGPSPEDSDYATFQNVAKAKRRGYEMETRFTYAPFMVNASFEHLDQYDSQTQEKVPNAFADKLRVGVQYTYKPLGVTMEVNVNHWFKPDQNPEYIIRRKVKYYKVNESYTITNLRVKWVPADTGLSFFDQGFELFGGVNNLFNDEYINARGYANSSRSGKGRNIFFNISKKF